MVIGSRCKWGQRRSLVSQKELVIHSSWKPDSWTVSFGFLSCPSLTTLQTCFCALVIRRKVLNLNFFLTWALPTLSPTPPNRSDRCLSLFCVHLGKKQQHKAPFMILRQNRGVYKGRLYALVPFSCQLYNTSCRWVVTAFLDVHRRVEKIAEAIQSSDIEKWGSCHCTGDTVLFEVNVNVT